VDVIVYFAWRREGDADSSRFLAAAVPQLAWLIQEAPPAPSVAARAEPGAVLDDPEDQPGPGGGAGSSRQFHPRDGGAG
jgi:hypothetical protein